MNKFQKVEVGFKSGTDSNFTWRTGTQKNGANKELKKMATITKGKKFYGLGNI